MADPLANLKANFQSLKADFESLIIANFKSQLDRKKRTPTQCKDERITAKLEHKPNWKKGARKVWCYYIGLIQ
jgi:hypothetical protein